MNEASLQEVELDELKQRVAVLGEVRQAHPRKGQGIGVPGGAEHAGT
jgi:hypothetical protein